MSEKNYQVNYTINVDASEGTKQLTNFGEAVGKLVMSKRTMDTTMENIRDMMKKIDRIFTTKGGRRRSYAYKLNVDTGTTEEKLERIKKLLGEIGDMSKSFNLVINAGQPLDSRNIKANAKKLIDKKSAEANKIGIEQTAASSVRTMMETQKRITKVVGKINAALVSLQRGREVNIQTDVAKERLQEILSLLNSIKGSSNMTLGLQMNSPGTVGRGSNGTVIPYAAGYRISDKAQAQLQEKLYTSQQLHRQKLAESAANFDEKLRQKRILSEEKETEQNRRETSNHANWLRRQEYLEQKRVARQAEQVAERKRKKRQRIKRKRRRMQNVRNSAMLCSP